MPQTVEASTSIVLIDSSQIPITGNPIVYLPSTVAGRTVTVHDVAGALSYPPEQIQISTLIPSRFADGSSTVTMTQPYQTQTLTALGSSVWTAMNPVSFPEQATEVVLESVSTQISRASQATIQQIQTSTIQTDSQRVQSTFAGVAPIFVSSAYVNAFPESASQISQPSGQSFQNFGSTFADGSTAVGGNLSMNGAISTGSTCVVLGSMSTLGAMNVQGILRVGGIFRPSNLQLSTVQINQNLNLSSPTTIAFGLVTASSMNVPAPGSVVSTVESVIAGQPTFSNSFQVGSTLFTPFGTQVNPFLRANQPIEILSSMSTQSASMETLTTQNLSVTGSMSCPQVSTLGLSSTQILLSSGTFALSSIQTPNFLFSTGSIQEISTATSLISSAIVSQNFQLLVSGTTFTFGQVTTSTIASLLTDLPSTLNLQINQTQTTQFAPSSLHVNQLFQFPSTSTFLFQNSTTILHQAGTATVSRVAGDLLTVSRELRFLSSPVIQTSTTTLASNTTMVGTTTLGTLGCASTLFVSSFITPDPIRALIGPVPVNNPPSSIVLSSFGITMRNGRIVSNMAIPDLRTSFPSTTALSNTVNFFLGANDMTTRNLFQQGSLRSTSDPRVKEEIQDADLGWCQSTIRSLPLVTQEFIPAYQSTFHVLQRPRVGVLTTDVQALFPKSVRESELQIPGLPSTLQHVEMDMIEMAHLGTTQYLLQKISTLRGTIAELM